MHSNSIKYKQAQTIRSEQKFDFLEVWKLIRRRKTEIVTNLQLLKMLFILMCVYQMPWFSSPWHSCKLEVSFVGVRLLQPENETQRPEQIVTNRSSHMYPGKNILNVLSFEAICIIRSLDLCYLIRSSHTLRTCSALGTSLSITQWQLPKLGKSQCNKSVQGDSEDWTENSKIKDGSGIYQFHREQVCLKEILWDGKILSEGSSPVFIYVYQEFGHSTCWFWGQNPDGNALLFKSWQWRVGAD